MSIQGPTGQPQIPQDQGRIDQTSSQPKKSALSRAKTRISNAFQNLKAKLSSEKKPSVTQLPKSGSHQNIDKAATSILLRTSQGNQTEKSKNGYSDFSALLTGKDKGYSQFSTVTKGPDKSGYSQFSTATQEKKDKSGIDDLLSEMEGTDPLESLDDIDDEFEFGYDEMPNVEDDLDVEDSDDEMEKMDLDEVMRREDAMKMFDEAQSKANPNVDKQKKDET